MQEEQQENNEPTPFWVDYLEQKRKASLQDSQKSLLFRVIRRDVRFLMLVHGWSSYTLMVEPSRVLLFYADGSTLRLVVVPMSVLIRKCNIRLTLEAAVQANQILHGA